MIVCLHGLGRSPSDWDPVRSGLEEIAEVATPILPREPAAALAAAAAATPAGATVIGHSMGGVVALRLVRRRHVRLSALILTESFFPPARNGRSTLTTVRDYGAHRVAFLRELRRRDSAEAAASPRSGGVAALTSLARLGVRRAAFDAAAGAVTAPVLVVHARDDHHVPVDFALAAASRHPRWDLELMESGGHHAHRTRPDAWLGLVRPWLRRRDGLLSRPS